MVSVIGCLPSDLAFSLSSNPFLYDGSPVGSMTTYTSMALAAARPILGVRRDVSTLTASSMRRMYRSDTAEMNGSPPRRATSTPISSKNSCSCVPPTIKTASASRTLTLSITWDASSWNIFGSTILRQNVPGGEKTSGKNEGLQAGCNDFYFTRVSL
jgi:hypothetical protein